MDDRFTNIKVTKETRQELKIISAKRNMTMLAVLTQVVHEARITLEKEETDALRPDSGQHGQD